MFIENQKGNTIDVNTCINNQHLRKLRYCYSVQKKVKNNRDICQKSEDDKTKNMCVQCWKHTFESKQR